MAKANTKFNRIGAILAIITAVVMFISFFVPTIQMKGDNIPDEFKEDTTFSAMDIVDLTVKSSYKPNVDIDGDIGDILGDIGDAAEKELEAIAANASLILIAGGEDNVGWLQAGAFASMIGLLLSVAVAAFALIGIFAKKSKFISIMIKSSMVLTLLMGLIFMIGIVVCIAAEQTIMAISAGMIMYLAASLLGTIGVFAFRK